jgi:hypothetical protein
MRRFRSVLGIALNSGVNYVRNAFTGTDDTIRTNNRRQSTAYSAWLRRILTFNDTARQHCAAFA